MEVHKHKWQYGWQVMAGDILKLHFVCECGKVKVLDAEEENASH